MNEGILMDEERGFLPAADPLGQLPPYFTPWEAVAQELPKLLISGQVRARIDTLPLLDAGVLRNDRQVRRAMTILSFLGHAYVWGDTNLVDRLPPVVAVP